ncbi:MAG TPA: SPOR domain-containing protein [Bacteroidales bacterium]|nr:SPOR domain-containing protein [Bacteroidales bacterium]
MELELAFYLKNLLYNYEEVTIPGLGTLMAKYKPAEMNDSEQTISPPSKILIFNEQKTQPGDLLIEYISFVEHISKDAASASVGKAVQNILSQLDTEATVLLDGIGYFSKAGNNIRFERIQDYNYLTDSYGLSKVSFEPVETSYTPPQTEPAMAYKKKRNHTTLYLFLFIAVLAGGGFFVYLNYPDVANFIFKKKNSEVNNILKPATNDKVKQDSAKKSSDLESFFDSATDKRNALAMADSAKLAESGKKYYIIAGSFKTMAKAKQLSDEMAKEGYKNDIIQFEKNLYRISLGTYTDKNKAVENLLKIRFTKGDDAVWLLTE